MLDAAVEQPSCLASSDNIVIGKVERLRELPVRVLKAETILCRWLRLSPLDSLRVPLFMFRFSEL